MQNMSESIGLRSEVRLGGEGLLSEGPDSAQQQYDQLRSEKRMQFAMFGGVLFVFVAMLWFSSWLSKRKGSKRER